MATKFSKGDRVKVLPLTTDMFKAGTLIQELIGTPIWQKALEHEGLEGVVENTDGITSYVRFESGGGTWTYDFALEKIKEKKYALYCLEYGQKGRLCALDSIAEAKLELYSYVKMYVNAKLAGFQDVDVKFDFDNCQATINSDVTYYIMKEEV